MGPCQGPCKSREHPHPPQLPTDSHTSVIGERSSSVKGAEGSARPWCKRLRWMSESQQVRDDVDSLRRILRERKKEVAARDELGKANQYQDVATLGNPADTKTPGHRAPVRAAYGAAHGRRGGPAGWARERRSPPVLPSSADLACAHVEGRRS